VSKADNHYETLSFTKRMIASIERLDDKVVRRGRVALLTKFFFLFLFSFYFFFLLDNDSTIGDIVDYTMCSQEYKYNVGHKRGYPNMSF
jgi:hypothetical protein